MTGWRLPAPGGLPFGLTPADLTRPHASQPWNPLMADVFYRRGIIEQWGRGTLKIIDLTEQAGLVTPEFEVRGGEVVVRFNPQGYVPPSRVTRDLTPLQQEMLAVLAALGPVSIGELRNNLSEPFPRPTVKDNLQILRHLGLAQLHGQGRGARWSLS